MLRRLLSPWRAYPAGCLALVFVAVSVAPAQAQAANGTGAAAAGRTAGPRKAAASAPAARSAPSPAQRRAEQRAQTRQQAAGVAAAEAALSPAELDIAQKVYLGRMPCELGAFVTVAADARSPGYFDVQIRSARYRMFPVETSTGAVRLEDRRAGAVWLQLANKSMLMNQKLGQRVADACVSPEQAEMAENLQRNPPPSLLEPLDGAATK